MRFVHQLSVAILLGSALTLPAQTFTGQQYSDAVAALQQGDTARGIKIAEQLTHSSKLDDQDLWRVWLLLGTAYRVQGDYRSAQHAYDNAGSLVKNNPHAVEEYAMVLRESGRLYQRIGKPGMAEQLEQQSLQLSEDSHDHAQIARSCVVLAEFYLDRGKLSLSEKLVSQAEEEARLTNELDDDDRAYLAQLQGSIALKRVDPQSAITNLQQAIDLYTRLHGANFVLAGWGYVLLGNAYNQQGLMGRALEATQKGMTVLDHAVGNQDIKYAKAEIQYAWLLDKVEQRSLASWWRTQGESILDEAQQKSCPNCTMDVPTFH
jgi:tetratricopeptide (TPR) repeat protein